MISIIDVSTPHPYPPVITTNTQPFWAALTEGRFITTGVPGETPNFPPRAFDRTSWSDSVEWIELSGKGVLYSITEVHAAPSAFTSETPYCVAIVDLEEGIRLATRFLGDVTTPLDSRIEIVAVRHPNFTTYAARAAALQE